LCRASFFYGAADADLALVLGAFDEPRRGRSSAGGTLGTLCDWLGLPRLAVLDVSQIKTCCLPDLPDGVVGLLLDRVAAVDLAGVQTTLEALWGVPVLGALPEMPREREMIRGVANGRRLCGCLCERLSRQLEMTLRPNRLAAVASRQSLAACGRRFFHPVRNLTGRVVAVAYDDAFFGYFPDALDLLELSGARVVDFSPLRDEALPPGTDLVYIGGGAPHRYAEALAANQCLTLALREHVRRGRQLYAEAGGLAYLCSELKMPCGRRLPMAGVFSASAVYRRTSAPAVATEVTLRRDHWLGPRGAEIRGYCDPDWHIEPVGPLTSYVAEAGHGLDLVGCRNAIGSRLQVNFAAEPDTIRRLFAATGQPLKPVTA